MKKANSSYFSILYFIMTHRIRIDITQLLAASRPQLIAQLTDFERNFDSFYRFEVFRPAPNLTSS